MLIVPFDMDSAGDARGFARAVAKVRRAAAGRLRQLAVVAKIEGTATLNDRSRELASACFRAELERVGGASLRRRTLEILSVGCEGIITPGGTLFASVAPRRARASDAPGLVMGHGRSAAVPMRDRASLRHIAAAERAVRAAMRAARLSVRQSAFVLIKSPVRVDGARPTEASRGAAALGAALGCGSSRAPRFGPTRCCATRRSLAHARGISHHARLRLRRRRAPGVAGRLPGGGDRAGGARLAALGIRPRAGCDEV